MDYASESLKRHYDWKGKIEVVCRCPLRIKMTYPLPIHRA